MLPMNSCQRTHFDDSQWLQISRRHQQETDTAPNHLWLPPKHPLTYLTGPRTCFTSYSHALKFHSHVLIPTLFTQHRLTQISKKLWFYRTSFNLSPVFIHTLLVTTCLVVTAINSKIIIFLMNNYCVKIHWFCVISKNNMDTKIYFGLIQEFLWTRQQCWTGPTSSSLPLRGHFPESFLCTGW